MGASDVPVSRFPGGAGDVRIRVERVGQCHPPLVRGAHAHEYFAILLFARRDGWHEVDGERRPAAPGALYAVPPGAAHDAGGSGVTVAFMEDAVNGAPLPGRPRQGVAALGDRAQLQITVETLDRELRERRPGYIAAARAQLSLLLIAVQRLAGDEAPADPVLTDVLEIIERGFRGPLSLAAIAAQVSRSPRHLTRTIRGLTGATVMHLVDDRRMKEARRLLLETDAKIEAISRSVGFHDDGYFRRRFRRAHGIAPNAWRERNR